jgi:hypothetical protein
VLCQLSYAGIAFGRLPPYGDKKFSFHAHRSEETEVGRLQLKIEAQIDTSAASECQRVSDRKKRHFFARCSISLTRLPKAILSRSTLRFEPSVWMEQDIVHSLVT